jgi:transposase
VLDDFSRYILTRKLCTTRAVNAVHHFKRIGLEAGPLSQWLFSALAEAGLPVICVETRHMRAVLQARKANSAYRLYSD